MNFVPYFLRPEGSHIWLNRVRKANSTVWTNDRECETGRSITEHVHGNDINSTQCLALNMTSPNDVQHLLFAAPCEDQMKFVCILFKGNVSGNLFASCLWLCFLKSLLISSIFIFKLLFFLQIIMVMISFLHVSCILETTHGAYLVFPEKVVFDFSSGILHALQPSLMLISRNAHYFVHHCCYSQNPWSYNGRHPI